MKVLHIIGTVDLRTGGPIEGVISSSEVWRRHGFERHILSLDAPEAPCVANSPVQTFGAGWSGAFYRFLQRRFSWLRYGYSPHLTTWLAKNASSYDAVVINMLWNYTSIGAWRGLRKLDVPYFVFPHGSLDPWFNFAYPVKTIFKRFYWKCLEHKVLRDATGVLFTCEEERILAQKSFSPYVAREFVVGYGTRDVEGNPEEQIAAFFKQVPQAENQKIILYLSRIHEKKGVDILIEAFASLAADCPEWNLIVAGPDQSGLVATLKQRCDKLGIGDRIYWPGMLVGDAKWGAFRAAEFFVLPSHQENFGIAVAEAMALARPVLITNKVNIWREIEADGAGVVVNDDVEGVARGLRMMLEQSPDERKSMGRRARSCFLTRYDLEKNAMDLLALMSREIGKDVAGLTESAAAGASEFLAR